MSKALERVQNALKADEQRLLKKERAKVDSQNLGLLMEGLGEFAPRAKRGEFKKVVLRMLTVNRSLRVGTIKRSNLKEWHELSKFRAATEQSHKNFIGDILNNFQLMARFSRFMRQANDFVFKAEEDRFVTGKLDGSALMNLVAQKLHEAKISTAHLCWHEFVKPLRTHKATLQQGIDALKTQLHQLRSSYLQEISMLRDSKHSREDPLETIPEIRYFYEPLHSLEKSEQKFMIDLIREVLKMMMHSGGGQHKFSSSPLERFLSEVHDNELKQLREEIERKDHDLKELRQAQHFLETQLLKSSRPKDSPAGALEKMLHVTEDQLATVRSSFYKLQKEHQELSDQSKAALEERADLVARIEQEMNENGLLHGEIRRLCSVEEDQKQTIQTLENEHLQLKETIKELQARIEKMRLPAVVRRSFGQRGLVESDENREMAAEELGFQQGSHESHGRHDGYDQDMSLPGACNMEAETAFEMPLMEQMQQRIADLEKLLREHVVQLSTQSAQEMQEDAMELIQQAECLGCQVQSSPSQVRVCRCGNVLSDDASSPFCGKCGTQWTSGASMRQTTQQLALDVSGLQHQIEDTEQAMRDSHAEVGAAGTESSFTMSRILRPAEPREMEEQVTQEELIQQEELLQQRTLLEDLKKSKLLAETKLLAQRCKDLSQESGVDVMSALDEEVQISCGCDGVNCQYRRQVEVLREMVATLRGLCNQVSEKLIQATSEHVQMSLALTSMQGSLEAAVQVVDQSNQEVETHADKASVRRMLTCVSSSLKETKRRSVFWRLYHHRSHRKHRDAAHKTHEKVQEKRAALLQKTYEHLYKITPKASIPAPAHASHASHASHQPREPAVTAVRSLPAPAPPVIPSPPSDDMRVVKHTTLPAIERGRGEKSSKEKSQIPMSAVNLFVLNEEVVEKQSHNSTVFAPMKQPPPLRRPSKRAS
mgnify:CR=1 FL=1